MDYMVARKGHKLGHRPLVYGEVVNPQKLGVSAEALKPFIARGVLRPVTPKARVSHAEAPVKGKTER